MTDEEKKARNRGDRAYRAADLEKAKEKSRAWRAANPEKAKEQQRAYRAANLEKVKEQQRAYRAANREKVKEKSRARYAANREKEKARSRAYHAANREKAKEWQLKNTYGLTIAKWDALLQAQGNCCARCGKDNPGSKKGWAVDHCHDTGAVRGILCWRCNVVLGMQGDNEIAVFESALLSLRYLRKTICEDDTAGVCAGLL